jgi:hypothetical protein
MSPPRLECHSGPTALTTPSRALVPPAPSAPNASGNARRGHRLRRFQDRDIGAGIAPGQLCGNDRSARSNQFKILFSRQRLLRSDDDAALPYDTRDMPPVREANRNDGVFGGISTRGEDVGELDQKAVLIGHE